MGFYGGGGPSQAEIDARNEQNETANEIAQQQADDARAFNEAMLAQQRSEAAAAERRLAEQEARIAAATGAVQNAFSGADSRFDRFADTTFNLNRGRLADTRDDAAQQLKFALARSGLMGGSADVDKHQEVDDRFQSGLLKARTFADQEAARLRSQEQQARNRLLSTAASGSVGAGQIRSLAQDQVSGITKSLQSPSIAPSLGNTFAGLSDAIGQALLLSGFQNAGPPGADDQFNSFNQPNNKKKEAGTVIQVG